MVLGGLGGSLGGGGGGPVEIRIVANDGASAVFKKIGDSAKGMGRDVKNAGDDASGAFDDVETSAGTTGSAFDLTLGKATLLAGGIAGVGSALLNLATAAADHERDIRSVERAYGDTADEVLGFLDELEQSSPFPDEDLLAGERFFSTLSENFDLTMADLEALRTVTADLAATYGIDYADAANRVTAAIRGEAEAAEILGLTLNEQYLIGQGLSLTTDERANAQVRLNELLRQAERFEGAAADEATRFNGSMGTLTDTFQDWGIVVGGIVAEELNDFIQDVQKVADAIGVVVDVAGQGADIVHDFFTPGTDEIDAYNEALKDTTDTIALLKREGETERASQLERVILGPNGADTLVNELARAEEGALAFWDALDPEQQALTDPTTFANTVVDQYDEAIARFPELKEQINRVFADPDIDTEAYSRELEAIFASVEHTAEGSDINDVLDRAFALDPERFTAANRAITAQYGAVFDSVTQMAIASEAQQQAAVRETERVRAQAVQRQIEEAERLQGFFQFAGIDDPLSQLNLTSAATDASRFAESLGTVNSALASTFQIVVEGTDAWAGQTQAVEDWITSMTDVEEGESRLNELRRRGLITQEEYTGVIAAQRDILAANEQAQLAVLEIQAQQAPLLADLTEQQALYLETLSDLPAQQQLIALGWADANSAAQANEAITLAAAAANGEFGEAGYAATQRFIEGAIAANPVLESLLADIGLVARDHEGNLVINFDQAEGAQSDIEALTQSVDDLTLTLLGIPPVSIDVDSGQVTTATGRVIELDDAHAGLDGQTSTINVNANTSDADAAIARFNAINGAVLATSYVNIVEQRIGTGGFATPFATGGTVWGDAPVSRWGLPRAANGRTVLVGEAGPELVTLPHGSQVTPHGASMNRLEAGGFGGVTVHVHVAGSLVTEQEMIDKTAEAIWSAEVEELISHRLGAGVRP